MAHLLHARDISKAFPGVRALSEVGLHLDRGEVLAVVGENGAGKSTLMKVLGGVYVPDSGVIAIDGQPVTLSSVKQAEKQGIVLIHQELNLAEQLDVAGNIFLGREPTRGGPLRLLDRRIYADAERIMGRLGLDCPARTVVAELSIGQQQLVEIARALSLRSRILILDEPTSSLTERETDRLFQVIRDLKREGIAIIYISHRLKEVQDIADRVVVLRDGRNAGELQRAEINHEAIVRLMVGRELKQFFQRSFTDRAGGGNSPLSPVPRGEGSPSNSPLAPVLRGEGSGVRGDALAVEPGQSAHTLPLTPSPSPRSTGEKGARLDVRDLRWSTQQRQPISFSLQPGEIVGVAGLMGAGRTELAETIFGVRPHIEGRISIDGRLLSICHPRHAITAGIFLIPEDRRLQGLVLPMSVKDNISLASLHQVSRFKLVTARREQELAANMSERLNIRAAGVRQIVGLLSGGNQQKVVLAKWLCQSARVLILDEPTRGIDVGAKSEIYALMDRLARDGLAILMISSDLEEILGMSDRVLVMHEARLAGELARGELSEEAIMRLATGG